MKHEVNPLIKNNPYHKYVILGQVIMISGLLSIFLNLEKTFIMGIFLLGVSTQFLFGYFRGQYANRNGWRWIDKHWEQVFAKERNE